MARARRKTRDQPQCIVKYVRHRICAPRGREPTFAQIKQNIKEARRNVKKRQAGYGTGSIATRATKKGSMPRIGTMKGGKMSSAERRKALDKLYKAREAKRMAIRRKHGMEPPLGWDKPIKNSGRRKPIKSNRRPG
jgi:hypothetical protein